MATPARARSVVVHQVPTLWDQLTTPQILKGSVVIIWVMAALLVIVTVGGVRQHRQALQVVGRDAAPSVIAAEEIRADLAGMDASAANELILPPDKSSTRPYEDNREKLAEQLVLAAKNITYGEQEFQPLKKIAVELGRYERTVQKARDLRERDFAKAVSVYRDAAILMDNMLLQQAAELGAVNDSELSKVYDQQQRNSGVTVFFLWCVGIGLLVLLAGLQLFLVQRMRRLFNPFLLLATATLIIFLVFATREMTQASYELKVAKQDAFESLRSLAAGRANAYQANASESRYLLGLATAEDFRTFANKVLAPPAGSPLPELNAPDQDSRIPSDLKGALAPELYKQTINEVERQAASEMVKTWAKYLRIDRSIHAYEGQQEHQRAVQLRLGTGPEESEGVFTEFEKSVKQAVDVNWDEFRNAITGGDASLNSLDGATVAVAIALALLTFLGVRPRLREYNG